METATTEIYTLSLHDALPIWARSGSTRRTWPCLPRRGRSKRSSPPHRKWRSACWLRSEEHTSELQSRQYLVWRLLLEKKKELDAEIHLDHFGLSYCSTFVLCP